MASGMKTAGAAIALSVGLLFASNAAQADYSYTFTLTPTSGALQAATGSFTTDSLVTSSSSSVITSGNYNFSAGSNSYSGGFLPYITFGSFSAGSSLSNGQIGLTGTSSVGSIAIGGNLTTYTQTGFSGSAYATENTAQYGDIFSQSPSYSGTGLFEAFLSSPTSNAGTGGVPSPEVNALLGLALAGCTVAFLRRKRGGYLEATAA